jgi:hypothetical protein
MTNMTNTRTTLAIVAVLTAATLVVGVTLAAAAATTQSALASRKGGNENGNTVTILVNKQKAYQSGWDNKQELEASNVICTHPHDDNECVSEGD